MYSQHLYCWRHLIQPDFKEPPQGVGISKPWCINVLGNLVQFWSFPSRHFFIDHDHVWTLSNVLEKVLDGTNTAHSLNIYMRIELGNQIPEMKYYKLVSCVIECLQGKVSKYLPVVWNNPLVVNRVVLFCILRVDLEWMAPIPWWSSSVLWKSIVSKQGVSGKIFGIAFCTLSFVIHAGWSFVRIWVWRYYTLTRPMYHMPFDQLI